MGTRGSVRLNNNKNARRNESSLKILQPQQMDEVIVISDDSDNDSDVQVINWLILLATSLEAFGLLMGKALGSLVTIFK